MRETYHKMDYISNLVMISVHNNLRKEIHKLFYLTNREIAILISAYQIKEHKEWSMGYFTFTGLRRFHKDVYYPYEIYRSLSKLCEWDYVKRKSRNTYEICQKGEIVLSKYDNLFRNESERIYGLLHEEGLEK